MAANLQMMNDATMMTEINSLSPDKIKLLKSTFCKGATDDELELFIHACNRTKLDPFMKQIHFVKYKDKVSIITGIDGYRLIAERTGKYIPGREPTFTYQDGKLFSATSYVKKMAPDGSWHEIAATAIFSEYKAYGPMWENKGHIMISKCSEALALRRAFPADLSGLYTDEEMEQARNEEKPVLDISTCEKVEPVKKEEKKQDDSQDLIKEFKTASFSEIIEIESIIRNQILPTDADYLSRMLNKLKIESLTYLPADEVPRVRKNMAKKLAEIADQTAS